MATGQAAKVFCHTTQNYIASAAGAFHLERAGVPREVVDEEDAVQVVDLVQEDAREEALDLAEVVLAVDVLEADAGAQRSVERVEEAGERQAALVALLDLLGRLLDDGVDDRTVLVLDRDLPDEQALQDPDLVGGEPRPRGLAERVEHVAGEPTQTVVEVGDRPRLLPQDGVTEDPDVERRHPGAPPVRPRTRVRGGRGQATSTGSTSTRTSRPSSLHAARRGASASRVAHRSSALTRSPARPPTGRGPRTSSPAGRPRRRSSATRAASPATSRRSA
jgi:hypothetical protein